MSLPQNLFWYNASSDTIEPFHMFHVDTVSKYLPEAKIVFHPQKEIGRLVRSLPKKVDDTNARRDWGWRPEYDLDKAVQDSITEV